MPWWSRASASSRAKSLLGRGVAEKEAEEVREGGDGDCEQLRLRRSVALGGDAALDAAAEARRAAARVMRALLEDDAVLLIDEG